MGMSVPPPVANVMRHQPAIGERIQAFPFLTVSEDGFPHVCLLSAAETDVDATGDEIHIALASAHTRSNLLRTGHATLITVDDVTAHYCRLVVARTIEREGVLGAVLSVVGHKADTVGIPLEPLSLETSGELALLENWERSARVLAALSHT